MSYKLFLDDERFPVDSSWVIVRSYNEAKEYVEKNGIPSYVSFDHDLGDGPSGHEFARWLCNHHMDENVPTTFKWSVHSQNPVGKRNIEAYLVWFFEAWDTTRNYNIGH